MNVSCVPAVQTQLAHRAISHILSTERLTNPALEPLWERRDMLVRPTYWIIGACGRQRCELAPSTASSVQVAMAGRTISASAVWTTCWPPARRHAAHAVSLPLAAAAAVLGRDTRAKCRSTCWCSTRKCIPTRYAKERETLRY
jgi:hypothetical protein